MRRPAQVIGALLAAAVGGGVLLIVLLILAPGALAVVLLVVLVAHPVLTRLTRGRLPYPISASTGPNLAGQAVRGVLLCAAGADVTRGLAVASAGYVAALLLAARVLPAAVTRLAGTTTVVAALPGASTRQDRHRLLDAVSRPGTATRSRIVRGLDRTEPVAAAAVAAAWFEVAPTAMTIVVVVLAVLAGAVGCLQLATLAVSRRGHTAARFDADVVTSLREYAPEFLVYFSAPEPAAVYQLRQWLPYLLTCGRRFAIVTREAELVDPLARSAPGVPVVAAVRLTRLDPLVVPGVRAAVYVNNAMRNAQLLRHTGLRHLQLQHGESDKSPSVNKFFRAYDEVYVAGQAAIDRYAARGVRLDPAAVRVVGRPQTDGITTARPTRPTVLYAPTWEGFQGLRSESSVGTLGVSLVQRLLARGDVRVIVRPHPTTGQVAPGLRRDVARMRELLRAAGGDHVWSAGDGDLSLVDCFNASTVLIADVSSVVADYLRSEKGMIVTDVDGVGPDAFRAAVPTAGAAWILRPDAGNLDEILADALGPDRLRADRVRLRHYVLGDFDGPAAEVFHRTLLASLDTTVRGADEVSTVG